MLYWWKAVDPGPFKVGSEEYWQAAIHSQDATPPADNTNVAASDLFASSKQHVRVKVNSNCGDTYASWSAGWRIY
eukprot:742972-Pleurochrysis_carterae.AAC.1